MPAGHRPSLTQAAWVEQGSTSQQALLAQFMLKSTSLASKANMQDHSSCLEAAEAAAGAGAAGSGGAAASVAPRKGGPADRGYRSQPSSPARTRRELT